MSGLFSEHFAKVVGVDGRAEEEGEKCRHTWRVLPSLSFLLPPICTLTGVSARWDEKVREEREERERGGGMSCDEAYSFCAVQREMDEVVGVIKEGKVRRRREKGKIEVEGERDGEVEEEGRECVSYKRFMLLFDALYCAQYNEYEEWMAVDESIIPAVLERMEYIAGRVFALVFSFFDAIKEGPLLLLRTIAQRWLDTKQRWSKEEACSDGEKRKKEEKEEKDNVCENERGQSAGYPASSLPASLPPPFLSFYSCHDNTLMAVLAALGYPFADGEGGRSGEWCGRRHNGGKARAEMKENSRVDRKRGERKGDGRSWVGYASCVSLELFKRMQMGREGRERREVDGTGENDKYVVKIKLDFDPISVHPFLAPPSSSEEVEVEVEEEAFLSYLSLLDEGDTTLGFRT